MVLNVSGYICYNIKDLLIAGKGDAMKEIIIAYPVKATALQLRSMLENEGFHVSYVCATGASVLSIAQDHTMDEIRQDHGKLSALWQS